MNYNNYLLKFLSLSLFNSVDYGTNISDYFLIHFCLFSDVFDPWCVCLFFLNKNLPLFCSPIDFLRKVGVNICHPIVIHIYFIQESLAWGEFNLSNEQKHSFIWNYNLPRAVRRWNEIVSVFLSPKITDRSGGWNSHNEKHQKPTMMMSQLEFDYIRNIALFAYYLLHVPTQFILGMEGNMSQKYKCL